jgi:diguanylate cyclase (GGDEF)-like protein
MSSVAAAAPPEVPTTPSAAGDVAAVVLGAELVSPVDDSSGRLGWFAVGPRVGGRVGGARPTPPPLPAYDEADRHFLALLAHFAAPRIAHADLAAAYRHASLIDEVTGVGNRRAFEERLEEELARSNRSGQPVALILCELRAFDDYAVRHGAAARDRALRAVAAAASQSVRRSDSVFRHGSARVALVLTNTDAAGARIAADRIRRTVVALAPPDAAEPLACSLGIGSLRGVHKPLSLATLALYRKADEALHRAMRAGGSGVVAG